VRADHVRVRGPAVSAIGRSQAAPRPRTHVRGTGALPEVLPYYRWGLFAGVLGAFVVAVFFLILDLAAGRPFATPTALGAALFLGVPLDFARPPSWILITGYSAVHGGLFVALTLIVSSVVLGSPRRPPGATKLTLVLIGAFFASLTLLYVALTLIASPELANGSRALLVTLANLLASTAMALLLTWAFETRWRPESRLAPLIGRVWARQPRAPHHRASHGASRLRERPERGSRLDPEWFHLFSVLQFVRTLRGEPEYREQGRNGVTLLKTRALRIVLEVAAEGTAIAEHNVQGPAMVHVIDGALELDCLDEKRIAHAGEMVAIPHDRPPSIRAIRDATFVWTLARCD